MYLELWHHRAHCWESLRTERAGESITIYDSKPAPAISSRPASGSVLAEVVPSAGAAAALIIADGDARVTVDGQQVPCRLAPLRNLSILRLNGRTFLLRLFDPSDSESPGRCPLDDAAFGRGQAKVCTSCRCRICASCFETLAVRDCPICSRPFGDGRGPDAGFHPSTFFEEERDE